MRAMILVESVLTPAEELKLFAAPARFGDGQNAANLSAAASSSLVGILLPWKGCFVVGSIIGVPSALKSPPFCASVGTVVAATENSRMGYHSQDVKKKVRSFLMGPPTAKPYWFRRVVGRSEAKKFRAFSLSLRKNSHAAPCSWLVPDFVTTLVMAPGFLPNSAEKVLVWILNSSMESTLGR